MVGKWTQGVDSFQIQVAASQSERPMDFLPKVALNRLSPPSEAGAKETGSLIIVRWRVTRKGLEDIFG